MSQVKGRNTKPEVRLRQALHRLGLRFRVGRRPVPELRRTADVVFGPTKVAVMVDGCFWHRCPEHYRPATRRAEFWANKVQGNTERDADTNRRLAEAGWLVLRVWEHEDVEVASQRVAEAVRLRRTLRLPEPQGAHQQAPVATPPRD